MALYQRLRDLREDCDMTQAQVAEKLFMHPGQYARYERGERELPLDFAIQAAEFYGVSLDYLAGRTNSKTERLSVNDILHAFRMLSDIEKGQAFERIAAVVEAHKKPRKKPGGK